MGIRMSRLGFASLALAAAALAMSLLLPGDGGAALSKDARKKIMSGVVHVVALEMQGGEVTPVASGSGTIISADGAILTNHHVIYNQKEGRPYPLVAVRLLKSFDQEPVTTCVAVGKNALVRPELDLAVIKCEMDLQGKPFAPTGWPTVGMGSSEDLVPGDDIFVFGYPGIGGATIHVTAGKVSGFQGERGGAGRDWIKTDAAIAHGNSGGTAVDEDGSFIGVPSAFRATTEATSGTAAGVGLIRPVEVSRELVNRARAGWSPGDGGAAQDGGGQGGFGDSKPTPPPTPQAGVVVEGRVLASDNDDPVAGAVVLIFKPGVRMADVNRDNLGQKFLTKAITNREGEFVMEGPVPRGKRFAVLVAAEGYEILASDDVLITEGDDVPDRYDPWGVVRLERE